MSFLETRSTFQSSISITWSFSMTNSGSHIVLPQNTTNAAEREMGTKKTQTFPTAVNQKWPRPKLKHLQHQKIITSPTKKQKNPAEKDMVKRVQSSWCAAQKSSSKLAVIWENQHIPTTPTASLSQLPVSPCLSSKQYPLHVPSSRPDLGSAPI